MKKIDYQAPKMEILQMMYEKPLLADSEYIGGGGGHAHAPELLDVDE